MQRFEENKERICNQNHLNNLNDFEVLEKTLF